jgi:hypothetical protein
MKKSSPFAISYLLSFIMLAMSACTGAGGDSAAVTALESYLKALAGKDEARLSALSCPVWEEDALLEYDSFQAVATELRDLKCQQTGSDGDAVLVHCEGNLLATYGNEVQEFTLGGRVYRMEKAGQDWQVCGYSVEEQP